MKVLKSNYKIEFKKSAFKEYQKLPLNVKNKVSDALKMLSINPFLEILNYKKINAKDNNYRIRIGDYRIIYSLYNNSLIIRIIRVGHRKDVYKYF